MVDRLQNLSQRLLPSLQQIALLRALNGLGDFLCVVPTFRALRSAFPKAKITLIGLPAVQALCDRFSNYIDELWEFPGYPGLPERVPQLDKIPGFLAEAQKRQFDLAMQLHGSGIITNPVTALLGARLTAGFYLPEHYCPNSATFLPYAEQESEIRRYLQLLEFLGIPSQGEALEFPVNRDDREQLYRIPEVRDLQRDRYVCIHPGASVTSRRWAPEQFAAVAETLASWGFQIVLTGSAAERDLTAAIAQMTQAPVLNLAGQTSLGTLAALLEKTRLLICNDTGVSHLAAALKVFSVVIFTGSDPVRWAPLDRDRHRIIRPNPNVTVAMVLAQAQTLLQEVSHVA